MVKSMTGFGRCEVSEGERKMTVEMKSVNHRYLDVAIKMPKKLNYFESAIRSLLKTYIQRGKVDVFITYEDLSESNMALHYNKEIAGISEILKPDGRGLRPGAGREGRSPVPLSGSSGYGRGTG